jgi:hypothetical protein
VVNDLQTLVEEYITFGRVLGAINSTFITLIRNDQDPTTFDEYKPISLCNLMYKLISEIIANRLKGINNL